MSTVAHARHVADGRHVADTAAVVAHADPREEHARRVGVREGVQVRDARLLVLVEQESDAVVLLSVSDEVRVDRGGVHREDRTIAHGVREAVQGLGVIAGGDAGAVVRTGSDLVGADGRKRPGGRAQITRGDVGAVGVDATDGLVQGEEGGVGPHPLAVEVHADVDGVREGTLLDDDGEAVRPRTRRGGVDLHRRDRGIVGAVDRRLAGGRGGSDDTGDVRLSATLIEEGLHGVVKEGVGHAATELGLEVRETANQDGVGGRAALCETDDEGLAGSVGLRRRCATACGRGDDDTGHCCSP